MDDIEKAMMEYQLKKEEKRKQFLQKGLDKMTGELAYQSFALLICNRFELDRRYHGICGLPDVAYIFAEHFIKEVDEPFTEWINKNDAPFIRPLKEARKIFHEFDFLKDNVEIVELANKLYGLDLEVDYEEEYMYTFSLDFNSFTPVDITGLKELKEEIRVLEKHGVECDELKEQLADYGLTSEQLELI